MAVLGISIVFIAANSIEHSMIYMVSQNAILLRSSARNPG